MKKGNSIKITHADALCCWASALSFDCAVWQNSEYLISDILGTASYASLSLVVTYRMKPYLMQNFVIQTVGEIFNWIKYYVWMLLYGPFRFKIPFCIWIILMIKYKDIIIYTLCNMCSLSIFCYICKDGRRMKSRTRVGLVVASPTSIPEDPGSIPGQKNNNNC